MTGVETVEVMCPSCWQVQEIGVDCSVTDQTYVEDCQVCCRPMEIQVHLDADGEPSVDAVALDEGS